MKYFIDTSSLVKIYHKESGTSDILKIYNDPENLIQISELTCIEFLSTIHKKYREKLFTQEVLDIIINKFDEDSNLKYDILRFSTIIFDETEILLKEIALN
ncbi:type II toxin-antitoxin system VapC family toxin, partial [Desulfamplus magnetovallimortis]|uniref:type II toxin-antitoxin system VapC family toxin n=1 Tax=Desulfamplus magnetovallimortis TaxID=1246637 RepID=UPI0016489629